MHLRGLLDFVGSTKQGSHAKGPLVGVIKAVLPAVEGDHVSADAISKVLSRSAEMATKALSPNQVEARGGVVVG